MHAHTTHTRVMSVLCTRSLHRLTFMRLKLLASAEYLCHLLASLSIHNQTQHSSQLTWPL